MMKPGLPLDAKIFTGNVGEKGVFKALFEVEDDNMRSYPDEQQWRFNTTNVTD